MIDIAAATNAWKYPICWALHGDRTNSSKRKSKTLKNRITYFEGFWRPPSWGRRWCHRRGHASASTWAATGWSGTSREEIRGSNSRCIARSASVWIWKSSNSIWSVRFRKTSEEARKRRGCRLGRSHTRGLTERCWLNILERKTCNNTWANDWTLEPTSGGRSKQVRFWMLMVLSVLF